MRVLFLLFVVFLFGCTRSSVCEQNDDCFSAEACLDGTCVLSPQTELCPTTSCIGDGVGEIGCREGACFVQTCEPNFVLCDEGCCAAREVESGPIPFDKQGVVSEPDLVFDAEGRPHIMWADDTTAIVYISSWTGAAWSTRELSITPGAIPIFDFDFDGEEFWLAYTTFGGEVWLARSDDAITWFTTRAIRGEPFDPDDPIGFIVINLNITDEEPAICALKANFDILFFLETRAGFPEAHLAILDDEENKFVTSRIREGESVYTCEAIWNPNFDLHVAFTTFTDIDVAGYQVQLLGESLMDLTPIDFGFWAGRDGMVLGENGVSTMYSVYDLDAITNEITINAYEASPQNNQLVSSQIGSVRANDRTNILGMKLMNRDGVRYSSFSVTDFSDDIANTKHFVSDADSFREFELPEQAEYFTTAVSPDGEQHVVWTPIEDRAFNYIVP